MLELPLLELLARLDLCDGLLFFPLALLPLGSIFLLIGYVLVVCFGSSLGGGLFSLLLSLLYSGLIVEVDLLGRDIVGGEKVSQSRLRASDSVAITATSTPANGQLDTGRKAGTAHILSTGCSLWLSRNRQVNGTNKAVGVRGGCCTIGSDKDEFQAAVA